MPNIVHFREKCIGCNSCVEHAPGYWKMSKKDGKANLIGSQLRGETFVLPIQKQEIEENEAAAEDCPVNIIRILNR